MRIWLLVILVLTFARYSHADCSGVILIAFHAGQVSDFEKFREENEDQIHSSFSVLDAPMAGDDFGKINYALLTKPGSHFKTFVTAARARFKNVKALCGRERLPPKTKSAMHITARLSKFRSEAARPLAERAMEKTMAIPNAKYGIFEKMAVHIEEIEGFKDLDDMVLYAFEKGDGREVLAKDQHFKQTEGLFNKIYTTNYLYLEMKPL